MEIVNGEEKIKYDTAVALGNFDGIHLGHKKLIDTMRASAKTCGLVPSVFTFNYDFQGFKVKKLHSSIVSESQKKKILEDLGVKILYVLDFNERVKNMEPEDFVREVLIEKLNASLVVVGFNFKFGHNAKGDTTLLNELSKEYGFKLEVISPVMVGESLVSSTLIRELIEKGDIELANEMIGRPYSLKGTVIRGKGRGHKLGFATANLSCDADYVIPRFGVYDSVAVYNGVRYRSITNIGANPTFADVDFSIETHILDFKKDIYGEEIEIELLDFLRDEMKFSSVEDLVYKVREDIEIVRGRHKVN